MLAGGLGLVRDYGVSFDEGTQRIIGQTSLLYVFQQLPTPLQRRILSPEAAALISSKSAGRQLHRTRNRDYGVAFELPVAAAEQLLRLREERQVYLFRHVCNLLVCLAGLGGFYYLVQQRFDSWQLGLLGTLLLVLSPRQFVYNSKDAVFMALFTIAVATAVPFIRRPTWRTAAWHALACAVAIDVRIMGVLLPAACLALMALRNWRGDYYGRRVLGPAALYLTLLVGLVVAMWPYLWAAPLSNFWAAYCNMSYFRWPGSVLYQGKLVQATALPWHYVPVWISLTTPLLYLGGFGLGAALIVRQAVASGWRLGTHTPEWQDVLFLGLTLAPIITVISLHSVLYNGWRQLYFIYPTLLLVALRGLVAVGRWRPQGPRLARTWWWGWRATVAAALFMVAGRMVRLHPYEHLYFNALSPNNPAHFYEADYWGLGTRAALAWVMAHDNRPQVRVQRLVALEESLLLNRHMLPAAVRHRLLLVPDAAQADYIIQPYSYQRAEPKPYLTPCYSLYAEQVHVLDIFCRRPTPASGYTSPSRSKSCR
ncbi:MAG: hypothetical protein ACRYGH_38985 [Janthinobacterium lividum]